MRADFEYCVALSRPDGMVQVLRALKPGLAPGKLTALRLRGPGVPPIPDRPLTDVQFSKYMSELGSKGYSVETGPA